MLFVFSTGCPELEEPKIKTLRTCWTLLTSGIVWSTLNCPCTTFLLLLPIFIVVFSFFSGGAPIWDGIGKLFKESTAESLCVCLFIPGTCGTRHTNTFLLHYSQKKKKERKVCRWWAAHSTGVHCLGCFLLSSAPKVRWRRRSPKRVCFWALLFFKIYCFDFCVCWRCKNCVNYYYIYFVMDDQGFPLSEPDTSRRFCTVECTWKWKGKWKI